MNDWESSAQGTAAHSLSRLFRLFLSEFGISSVGKPPHVDMGGASPIDRLRIALLLTMPVAGEYLQRRHASMARKAKSPRGPVKKIWLEANCDLWRCGYTESACRKHSRCEHARAASHASPNACRSTVLRPLIPLHCARLAVLLMLLFY